MILMILRCDQCGRDFERPICMAKSYRHFCSKRCLSIFQSKPGYPFPPSKEQREERRHLLELYENEALVKRRLALQEAERLRRPYLICKRDMYGAVHRILRASGVKKTSQSRQYIGCSPGFLRNHLESLFKPGMTWENRGDWEIDHIIPLSWWDLKNHPEHMFFASHWTNLQPMWKKDNHVKGNRASV